MHWYSFIPGRTPELSRAELESVLKQFAPACRIICAGPLFFVVAAPDALPAEALMGRLGGAIKIGEGITMLPPASHLLEYADALAEYSASAAPSGAKMMLGVSVYGPSAAAAQTLALGLAIKKILKDRYHISCRFVTSRGQALSSVVVATNKLISERGIEFQILFGPDRVYIARTRSVQPFAEFSERDYGRPATNAHSGMLPPKLARMMVNLAELKNNENLLDPFCGSGTILMEASLLHPRSTLYGSDASEQAVSETRANLEWLVRQKMIPPQLSYTLSPVSIQHISQFAAPHSINAIVTEPFLGPALTGTQSPARIKRIISELNPLFAQTLEIFHTLLAPHGRIVMAWPVFFCNNKYFELPAFQTIAKHFSLAPLTRESPTVIYARPDQKIGRRICRLVKRSPLLTLKT